MLAGGWSKMLRKPVPSHLPSVVDLRVGRQPRMRRKSQGFLQRASDVRQGLTSTSSQPVAEEKIEVIVASSNDVERAESEASREELQALVRQLRLEVGTLRTELEHVKNGGGTPVPGSNKKSIKKDVKSKSSTSPTSSKALSDAISWPSRGSRFWNQPTRKQPGLVLDDVSPPGQANVQRDQFAIDVVHITAEMAPVAKVGGLGDVVQGLAKASLQRGHNIQVVLPYYTCMPEESLINLEHIAEFDCPKGETWDGQMRQTTLRTSVHRATIDGIPVLLISPSNRDACNLFRGDRIYGGSYNELEAYLFFCRASLEALRVMGARPGVLHLHEWQCAAVSMLYWDVLYNTGFNSARVVLTIHNMDNSGECRQDEFAVTGVPGEMYADINKALDERTIGHNPERLNLLKGGIVYSNAVTTVSPTYAEEVRTGGAAGFLRTVMSEPHISAKFSGVLNGIDTQSWCPATDPDLPAPFSSALPAGKALCKRFVQRGLGLSEDASAPLVVCITRLVPQKGIHLIKHAALHCAAAGYQFVLLGSGHADGDFRGLSENELKGSEAVKLLIMYSERLSHMLYGAADFVLVPSLFEPCGLTQMIAMRYGALPIVRRTGGLADTVIDIDEESEKGNGFVFDGADEGSCAAALDRAVDLFKTRPKEWEAISRKNMDSDMSWTQSAASYIDLYRGIMAP